MPTLSFAIRSAITNDVSFLHTVPSQHMKLRQITVEYGIPTSALATAAPQEGILLDLTDFGASTSEILSYTPNVGATPFLYLPRPGPTIVPAAPGDPVNPITTFYTMQPDLSFYTGDIKRTNIVRVWKDNAVMTEAAFGDDEVREIVLYFEYKSNDETR